MKRNYDLSAFVLAMASVFVMALPQNASAQGFLKGLPRAAKNLTRVGVISGYRAAKGYDNAVRNARLNSNLNRQARLSHINNGVAVGGVKNNAVNVVLDKSKNKTKKTGVKRNPKAKQAKVEAQKKKDILNREDLYARAMSALLDDKNKEFVSLIRRSSDAQYAPAQYAYAMSNLERCEGRERDKWLELVRRSADAMYMLTFLYNDAECYDSVREWGMRPELADSADIQYVVGCSYYNEEEYKKSIDYFVRAAEGGNVYGKWMAYVVYATILCDEDKAFEYVRQAAEAGYPDAMNDLAICYLNADHVDRDVAKALQLFGQAKDAGYLPAYNNLGCVYYAKKSEYGMKPDRKRAARYWYEGAEKGDPNSMFNYAKCQIKGKYGVAKNEAEGYGLMRKAAEAGSFYIK